MRRRAVLGMVGVGALIVGFDPVSRSWATETRSGIEPVPELDGSLHLDEPTRAEYSRDAGRYVEKVPQAVLRPGSVRDIQKMVQYCARLTIPVAPRGLANTTHGQGLVSGLLIEMRALRTIHHIDPGHPRPPHASLPQSNPHTADHTTGSDPRTPHDTTRSSPHTAHDTTPSNPHTAHDPTRSNLGTADATRVAGAVPSAPGQPAHAVVDAGVDWLELTDAAHTRGLTPPALTGYLGLTVGGTLSLGGIPPAIQSGGQVDSVIELEVVTGTGDLHRCSATHDRELFEAVLAGLGQYGIITKATVRLEAAPERVRGHSLAYSSAKDFFADFKLLLQRGEISEIYGDWWRPGEHGEVHHLNAFTFHPANDPPDDAHLLRGLTKPATDAEVTQNAFLPHVTRIDEAVAQLRELLDWDNLPKPWFTVWLPEASVERYVTELVPSLTSRDVGTGGFVLLYAHRRSKLTRPNLSLPVSDGSDWLYLFTLMTAGPADAGADFITEMLHRNRRFFTRAQDLGGVRYPIESVPFTPTDWQRHYGNRWQHLTYLKRHHDPAGILTPGPGIF